VQKCRNR